MNIFAENGERLPQGVRLECEDNVNTGAVCHVFDEGKIVLEALLFEYVHGAVYALKSGLVYDHFFSVTLNWRMAPSR